jgi:hypothetical protein
MDLHKITENALALSETGKTLTMDQYDEIIGGSADGIEQSINEVRKMQQLAGLIK